MSHVQSRKDLCYRNERDLGIDLDMCVAWTWIELETCNSLVFCSFIINTLYLHDMTYCKHNVTVQWIH